MAWQALRDWTGPQKHTVAASYLGWTLDAFDFFLLVLVIKDIAAEFKVGVPAIAVAVTLTLACRPLGAFIFGRLADRFGRRPILMTGIAVYSLLSFSTAFVPSLTVFLVVRALFGVGMGAVWGIGASLAMETIKPRARGFVSGLLQSGYPTGYLLASVVYWLLYAHVGWRGLFMVGIIPALLLIPYIRAKVPESPAFDSALARQSSTVEILRQHCKLALYAILLMTAFNFFSHGTQDLYPTFLEKQHGFSVASVSRIVILYNIGAILGGISFGVFSQSFGRRRTMILAALLSVPVAYFWAFSSTAAMLAIGAFVMQFFVQGAWGVIPAHLNELSPSSARGTFAGTVYQLGNFIASVNAVMQATLAERAGGNYSIALAAVAVSAALAIALLVKFGPEAHNVEMGKAGPL